jgi:hypothetical protein
MEHRASTVPHHPRLLFQFGSIRHLVGLLGGGDQPSARPLATQDSTTQKDADMRAGFEPVIPMFKRPKTVLALDHLAIETG